MLIDLTPDGTKGQAAINAFTFKGGEMIHNWIEGVGGRSGLASGAVSSPVAGSKEIMWGLRIAVEVRTMMLRSMPSCVRRFWKE